MSSKAFVLVVLFGLMASAAVMASGDFSGFLGNPVETMEDDDYKKALKSSPLLDPDLSGFRLRERDGKFMVYDGRDKYFEILEFSGTDDDLVFAMRNQPFATMIVADGDLLVVVSGGKRIYLEKMNPEFSYSEWKSLIQAEESR